MRLKVKAKKGMQWLVPLAALCALGAMQAWKATLPDASAGRPFLDGIKAKFTNFPKVVGDWEGVDGEIPPQAVAMLHPNFYLDRQYTHMQSRETVGLLLIEAEDSRDMMGHYPPNCYPGNGWVLVKQEPAKNAADDKPEWIVPHPKSTAENPKPDLRLMGTLYEFRRELQGEEHRLWVRNFFLLPNGKICPNIETFNRAAADFYVRPYGATQVQVVYNREYHPEDMERIFVSLISAHMDLIEALRKKD
jgi:hypothetical protein